MPSLLNTDSRENVKLHFLRELLGVINGLKEIRDFFDKYSQGESDFLVKFVKLFSSCCTCSNLSETKEKNRALWRAT